MGSRDGVVERASHQCGPFSIPGVDAICGLSPLLVLVPALRVFTGFSSFPPSTKSDISEFQFSLKTVDEERLHGYATISFVRSFVHSFIHSFILLFIYKVAPPPS